MGHVTHQEFSAALLLFNIGCLCLGVQQITNPHIVEHPQDQYVAKNEPATLNCKAEGDPPPIITWYKNGQPVTTSAGNPSSHRMLLPSGQLFFLRIIHMTTPKGEKVQPDVGVYYCKATNPETQISVISRNATLEIAKINMDFRTLPKDQQVVLGETARLECVPPRGQPEPRVKWKKDGEVVQPSSRVIVEDKGDIIVHEVRKEDAGVYMCIAYNPAGQRESNAARLSVLEKPQFVKKPDDTTSEEGADVVFQCQAKGEPEPTIIWTRENEQVPMSRSEIMADRSLKITKIRLTDQGLYVCRAENAAGFIEATANLVVHSQPSFIVTPRDKSVGVGRRVSFRCEVTGNPPPAVFWNKAASQALMFPRQDNGRFSVSDDGTLTIEPVRKEDDGDYQCQALSLAGSAFAKARLEVKDEDPRPPPIIHQGPQNQTLPLNSVALLQCTASGDPMPVVRWFKDGHPLALNEPRFTQLDSGTLQISDLKKQDTGMYTCVTSSETGETTWSAALKVEAPTSSVVFHRTPEPSTFPGIPSKPEVVEVKDTSVRLKWKPNANHGASPVQMYTVEYASQETGEGWIVASRTVTDLTYTVSNLRPDTSYMFVVRAQNSHGLSNPSPVTSSVHTLGGKGAARLPMPQCDQEVVREKLGSSNIVEMLQPKVLSSTEIEINWKVVKLRECIEGFHVKYRIIPDMAEHSSHEHHHIEYTIETVSSNTQSSYVIRNLRKTTSYEISVQPFYMNVEGQGSRPVMVQTMEDIPSAAPRSVSVRVLDNTSIIVSWSQPPPDHHNGPLRGYKVYVYGNETKFSPEVRTNASVHSVLIQRLIAGMPYRIQVAAINRMGEGKKSDPISFGGNAAPVVGIMKQPWFIGTLVGVGVVGVGGLIVCVFLAWLFIRRCSARKMKKHNGSVNIPLRKAEDMSRQVTAPLLTTHHTLPANINNGYPSQATYANTNTRDDACYSLDRGGSMIYEKLEPTTGTAFSSSHDFEVKENMLNAAELAAFAPLRTFYNKNQSAVAPYAMANVTGTMLPPAESPFRPIQQSPGPQHHHQLSLSGDEYLRNDNITKGRVGHRHNHVAGQDLCAECDGRLTPHSDYGCMTADEEGMDARHQPKLCIPPPPDHPPPSEMGSPPDSPSAPVRQPPFSRATGIHMDYGSQDMMGRGAPYGSQENRGGGRRPMGGGYSSQGEMAGFSPHHYLPHPHRLVSPASVDGAGNSLRGVGGGAVGGRHLSHAVSEPEHSPSHTMQAYHLVPVTENELMRHYSDTDHGLLAFHMVIPHDSPPSPTPDDPMMDRAMQSSLPSLASECHMEYEPGLYPGDNRMESPVSEVGAVHDYVGDSDGESAIMRHRASPRDRSMGDEVTDVAAGEAAEHSDDSVDSLSSSDGSLLDADADFASAVARAAQLSGLTVVGSTVINDNAAARHNMAPSKDKGRPKKRRERAKRPTSPYSTDSNYSSIVVPHKPYPKADRRRQLEQQKGRAGSDKRSRPAPVAKPPNLPSAPKPNLPPATRAKPDMGVMRQMSGPMGVTTAAGYPVTTSVIRQLANKSLSPDMTVRTNPLDAFDTADTPIV